MSVGAREQRAHWRQCVLFLAVRQIDIIDSSRLACAHLASCRPLVLPFRHTRFGRVPTCGRMHVYFVHSTGHGNLIHVCIDVHEKSLNDVTMGATDTQAFHYCNVTQIVLQIPCFELRNLIKIIKKPS
jgi:hypothetical protein